MKKFMIFAAAFAAMVACSKEAETVVDASHFEKGQEVTLTVKAGESSTRVSSALNSSNGIDFKWQTGDKIKVTVGKKDAEFSVSKLIKDGESAEFTGTMPASGDEFDVQYPYDGVAESALASQSYTEGEALPKNLMLFSKIGCTGTSFELVPQFAALRLNLWGTDQTIGKIVVTNTTSTATPKPTYTLNISDGVKLSTESSNPTTFFIVVPAGTDAWNFSAEVFDNLENSICKFTTSAAKTFTANEILNMPLKKVAKYFPGTEEEGIKIDGVVWAPVNCGYEATNYPYGKLYQWGRYNGCGYNDGGTYTETEIQATSSSTTPIAATEEDASVFYKVSAEPYDWLSTKDDTRWNSGSESSPSKASNDPCPDGWRVPTLDELGSLCYTDWDSTIHSGSTKRGFWDSTNKGWNFGSLFLPAAGLRYCNDGSAYYRGSNGYYWSSSVNGSFARGLGFYDGFADLNGLYRAVGYSVRCVQE